MPFKPELLRDLTDFTYFQLGMVDLLRQFLHNSGPSSFPVFLVETLLDIPLNRPEFKEKMSLGRFYL